MKRKSNPRKPVLVVLAVASTAFSVAQAQTLSWDGGMTHSAAGGSGTWDAGTTADWYPGTGTTDTVWTNGDNAIFGGTAGTATIASGGVTASNVTFNTAGYTIGGGTLTLTPGAVIALNAGTETISSTISAVAATTMATAFNTSGTGTLVLLAAPTGTGVINLTGGSTLQLGNNTAINVANSGRAFSLTGGSTLVYNDNSEESETTTVSGTGNVTYLGFGGGYLNVNGTATNTGVTTINLTNGITNHTYDDALYLGSTTGLSANATLNMLSGNLIMRASDTVAGLTGTGGFVTTDSTASLRLTVNIAAGQTYTYSGTIGQSTLALAGSSTTTNNNNSFAVQGAGTQILSGTNTFTGGAYIEGGTLELTGTFGATNSLHSDGINGIFDLDGSATTGAKAQTLGSMAFASGEGTLEETLGTASSDFLTISAAPTRTAGAVANYATVGGVNGTTVGTILTGQATGFIDQGTFYDLGKSSGAAYAFYDAGGFVRGFNYATDAGGSVVAGGTTLGTTTSASHVETTGAITAQTTATVSTVQMAGATGANVLTIGSGQTLTAAGVLLSGTGTGDATGAITGSGTLSGGSTELVLAASQAGDRLTVSAPIAGTGGLTQGGSGTVLLTAANTYSGNTAVAGGTLQIGNGTVGSLASGYAGNFVTGGNLVFNLPAASTTYSGTFTGMGNLTQSANTVIITGATSYTGATTVASGATLQFGNASGATVNGFASTITVANGGNLIFNDNANENLAAPIKGAGNVTFEGMTAGYYSINAPLTNTGTTTIALTSGVAFPSGTIFVDGDNTLSAGSVLNVTSGVVDIREAATFVNETVAGLSGTGGFVTTDGGRTVNLMFAPAAGTTNTYSGVVGPGVSADNGVLNLVMKGAGTQVLAGTNTFADGTNTFGSTNISNTGTTTVTSGTLIVTGSIAGSAVTVNGGTYVAAPASTATTNPGGATVTVTSGTFMGNGTAAVTGMLTATGGTIQPGVLNTPGRLEVGGNVTLNNATLAIQLNGKTLGTGYGSLVVDNNLSLTGANLQLSLGYTPAVGQVFDIAQVGNTNGQQFSSVNGVAMTLSDGSTFKVNGVTFEIGYTGSYAGTTAMFDDGGTDVVLDVEAIPEPSAVAILALTGAGAGMMAYRRRRRAPIK